MANQTVYPYGTGGELPSSIGIINDLTTGGVNKALSAEMGKTLNGNLTQLEAKTTDILVDSQTTEGEYVAVTTDGGNEIVKITEDGVLAASLRVGDDADSERVLVESDLDTISETIKDIETDGGEYFDESIEIMDSTDTILHIGKDKISSSVPIEINGEEVLTEVPDLSRLVDEIESIGEDVEILKSHASGGVSFSTNYILSDVINGNDLFIQSGVLLQNGSIVYVTGNSSTSFVNIMGVIYLEYDNLHSIGSGFYPIYLYDKNFVPIGPANVVVSQDKNTAGSLDLSAYHTAAYAVFCNDSDNTLPSVQMFTRTTQEKDKRNDVLVGAYYFAGWSETDFPNIHHTEALLNSGRKPLWGWLDHGSFIGEGWLITPQISLNSGTSYLSVLNSCLFHQDGQCGIYIREVGKEWEDITPTLPGETVTTATTTTADISAYSGKLVEIGFRVKTSPGDNSAIWTINSITIVSAGVVVYNKDYTDHNNFDCKITNTDVWKPATWTRGYTSLNGYVGTTVNQKDTSVIDKQIVLAKAHGVDYFMLEWFYYDDQSSFNEAASYAEDNHIAVHAFMNSCQKLGFKFAVMITNHEPFRIVGLQNWKDAIAYLDREYFRDPSYLVVDNKPVLYIFDKTEYRAAGPAEINDYFIELGWDGCYMLMTNYNTIPTSSQIEEKDVQLLYDEVKRWNITNYIADHQYNFVANVTCGWDTRPWAVRPGGYARPGAWYAPDFAKWAAMFAWIYQFAKVYNNGNFASVLICAWNEYGEGSYLVPTEDDKRGHLLLTIGDTKNNNTY